LSNKVTGNTQTEELKRVIFIRRNSIAEGTGSQIDQFVLDQPRLRGGLK